MKEYLTREGRHDATAGTPLLFRCYAKDTLEQLHPKSFVIDDRGAVTHVNLGLEAKRNVKVIRDPVPVGDLHVMQFTGIRDSFGEPIFCHDVILSQQYSYRHRKRVKKGRERRFMGLVVMRLFGHGGFYQSSSGEHQRYVEYGAEWRVVYEAAYDEGGWYGGGWSDFYDCERLGSIYDPGFSELREQEGRFKDALQGKSS